MTRLLLNFNANFSVCFFPPKNIKLYKYTINIYVTQGE